MCLFLNNIRIVSNNVINVIIYLTPFNRSLQIVLPLGTFVILRVHYGLPRNVSAAKVYVAGQQAAEAYSSVYLLADGLVHGNDSGVEL